VKPGDSIRLVDGIGGFAMGEVIDNHPKKCRLKVSERSIAERRKNFQITVAIAPTKSNERFETFLEKSTEIGIDRIIPLLCERSERKTANLDRYTKILLSAMKQSTSPFLPKLSQLTSFKDVLNESLQGEKYIAHCMDSNTKSHIKQLYSRGENTLILIGPEGDFSKEEVDMAKTKGFKEISLSDSRLRTETAGIVACQIIDFMNS
jgi:16S rRNA (uracil1498-N3)-methyltransferase